MVARIARECRSERGSRENFSSGPRSLFNFETPQPLRSVPKDHLLVRQVGLTKVAAVFDCRRHDRAHFDCPSRRQPEGELDAGGVIASARRGAKLLTISTGAPSTIDVEVEGTDRNCGSPSECHTGCGLA
jgi:hypothetical protein